MDKPRVRLIADGFWGDPGDNAEHVAIAACGLK